MCLAFALRLKMLNKINHLVLGMLSILLSIG